MTNIPNDGDYSQLKASTLTELIHSYLRIRKSADVHLEKLDTLLREARDRKNTINRVLWDMSGELISRDIDPPEAMYYAPREVLDAQQ